MAFKYGERIVEHEELIIEDAMDTLYRVCQEACQLHPESRGEVSNAWIQIMEHIHKEKDK